MRPIERMCQVASRRTDILRAKYHRRRIPHVRRISYIRYHPPRQACAAHQSGLSVDFGIVFREAKE